MKTYSVPLMNQIARFFLQMIFRGIFHLISRVEIAGRDNIPKDGAYVIAINHISLYDPPFVVAFWPVAPEVAGASDIWNRPGQSILARLYAGIPVHRGEFDRRMIDAVVSVLKNGYPLLIAPEGGRSHSPGMRKAHPGIAYLVDKARVPVVPVGVIGSTDDFLRRGLHGERPRIQMNIGKPIHLPSISGTGKNRKLMRQRHTDMIMSHIAAILPPDYRGEYVNYEQYSTETNQ